LDVSSEKTSKFMMNVHSVDPDIQNKNKNPLAFRDQIYFIASDESQLMLYHLAEVLEQKNAYKGHPIRKDTKMFVVDKKGHLIIVDTKDTLVNLHTNKGNIYN
jgi:hypothetical protein